MLKPNTYVPIGKKGIVFFDGVCHLCHFFVRWLVKIDKKQVLAYSSLQGEFIKKLPFSLDFKSVVYLNRAGIWFKSDAIIQIGRDLGGIHQLSVVAYVVPKVMRYWVYDLVASWRYTLFGKKASCEIPSVDKKITWLP